MRELARAGADAGLLRADRRFPRATSGRHEEAERSYALAEAAWRSDTPEPKNLARFLADRGDKIDEAVRVAEQAAAGRHDIFTNDALAWAYFKAGRLADAKKAIASALRTGTRDRDILAHARGDPSRGDVVSLLEEGIRRSGGRSPTDFHGVRA